MSILTIQTSSDPHYSQSTVLDGVSYLLRFAYNQAENCYKLSLQDPQTNVDILSGVKVVTNYRLLGRYRGLPGVPPGELMAISNTPDDSPPGLGELGENARVTLVYFDAAEIGNV